MRGSRHWIAFLRSEAFGDTRPERACEGRRARKLMRKEDRTEEVKGFVA